MIYADDMRWIHLSAAERRAALARIGAPHVGERIGHQQAQSAAPTPQTSSRSNPLQKARNQLSLGLLLLGFWRSAATIWLSFAPTKRVVLALASLAIAIIILAQFAPSDFNRPVAPSTIKGNPITGAVCSSDGGAASAAETNDSGPYPLYNVTCVDGVTMTVAQP